MRTVLKKVTCVSDRGSRTAAGKRGSSFPPRCDQLGTYDGTIYNARQVVDKIVICVTTFCLTPHGLAMSNLSDDG